MAFWIWTGVLLLLLQKDGQCCFTLGSHEYPLRQRHPSPHMVKKLYVTCFVPRVQPMQLCVPGNIIINISGWRGEKQKKSLERTRVADWLIYKREGQKLLVHVKHS